ncbi:MAG: hypothetical protein ACXW30_07110 [Micavibrio sp.]
MSPTLHHFGSAAQGQVPEKGAVTDVSIMGRAAPGAADILARHIGHGVETGLVELTGAAIEAKAAHAVKATPGGGLAATGDETVRYRYDTERNEALFTGRQNDPAIRP